MLGVFFNAVSAVVVLLLLMAVGYLLGHLGWMTENEKVFLGKCTGISFVDGTSFRVCRNQRIYIHKTSKYSSKR